MVTGGSGRHACSYTAVAPQLHRSWTETLVLWALILAQAWLAHCQAAPCGWGCYLCVDALQGLMGACARGVAAGLLCSPCVSQPTVACMNYVPYYSCLWRLDCSSPLPACRIDVPAGVATNAAGTANEAAWLEIHYEPLPQGWHVASYAMSGVLAGSTAVSWGTSLITSCLRPSSTAGEAGSKGMVGVGSGAGL